VVERVAFQPPPRRSFSGSLVVVTEHGWVDFTSDLGGYEPRLPDGEPAALAMQAPVPVR
jgi:hypothetical protein